MQSSAWARAKVSQVEGSPAAKPVLSQRTRWALVPWVKASGTTRAPAACISVSSPIAAAPAPPSSKSPRSGMSRLRAAHTPAKQSACSSRRTSARFASARVRARVCSASSWRVMPVTSCTWWQPLRDHIGGGEDRAPAVLGRCQHPGDKQVGLRLQTGPGRLSPERGACRAAATCGAGGASGSPPMLRTKKAAPRMAIPTSPDFEKTRGARAANRPTPRPAASGGLPAAPVFDGGACTPARRMAGPPMVPPARVRAGANVPGRRPPIFDRLVHGARDPT